MFFNTWKSVLGLVNNKEDAQDALLKVEMELLMNEMKRKGRSVTDVIKLLQNEKETPEHLLNCSICLAPYSKKNRLPLVGTCGHTVCHRCVSSLQTFTCPICRAVDSFHRPMKNYLACDLLEQMTKFHSQEEEVEHRKERRNGLGEKLRTAIQQEQNRIRTVRIQRMRAADDYWGGHDNTEEIDDIREAIVAERTRIRMDRRLRELREQNEQRAQARQENGTAV